MTEECRFDSRQSQQTPQFCKAFTSAVYRTQPPFQGLGSLARCKATLTTLSMLMLRMRGAVPHISYTPSWRGDHLSTGTSSVLLETNIKSKKIKAGS